MGVSRRDVLFGIGGFTVGGALAVAAGLSYRAYRRRTGTPPKKPAISKVDDGGWLITEEERAEIASADALVESDVLAIRDAVDIPGGDYSSLRVANLGECVSACEADTSCEAFTYARNTHNNPDKRRMCWMKQGEMFDPIPDRTVYVSGRRDGW